MCCICVTRRLAVQQTVAAVAFEWLQRHGHGFGTPAFADHVGRITNEQAILILDVPSIREQEFVNATRRWREQHRHGHLIAVLDATGADRYVIEPLVRLGAHVIFEDLVLRPEHWREQFAERTEEVLTRQLQHDMETTLHSVRSPAVVGLLSALLAGAPRAAVARLAELPMVQEAVHALRPGARLSDVLREHKLPPASQITVVFQTLWLSYLHQLGWTTEETAMFLRFGVPRSQMRYFNRTTHIGLKELRRLEHRGVFAWALEVCTIRWPNDVSLAAVVAPLQAMTNAIRAMSLTENGAEMLAVARTVRMLLGVGLFLWSLTSGPFWVSLGPFC